MKKVFILIFILTCGLFFSANKIKEEDFNNKIFQIEMESSQIFDKIVSWLLENLKSSKDIIELKDSENNKIICNGEFTVSYITSTNLGTASFKMIIDIKDGKYKINYSAIEIDWGTGTLPTGGVRSAKGSIDKAGIANAGIKQKVYAQLINYNDNLLKYINKKDDNW